MGDYDSYLDKAAPAQGAQPAAKGDFDDAMDQAASKTKPSGADISKPATSYEGLVARGAALGYSALTPAEQAALDAHFPSSQLAKEGYSLEDIHAAMDARAKGTSPQVQASSVANDQTATPEIHNAAFPSMSAASVQEELPGESPTHPLTRLLAMGSDIGSAPGRLLSGIGSAALSVGKDVANDLLPGAFNASSPKQATQGFDWANTVGNAWDQGLRSAADPMGSNIVSSIIKDPLTGATAMAGPMGRAVETVVPKAAEALLEHAPASAARAINFLGALAEPTPSKVGNLVRGVKGAVGNFAPIKAVASKAGPAVSAVNAAATDAAPVLVPAVKHAIVAGGLGVGASGLENGLYTMGDYQPGNTSFKPEGDASVRGIASYAGPALASGLLRGIAIRNFPGQRPMETMKTKQNVDQTMSPAERSIMLDRVTQRNPARWNQADYQAAAHRLRQEATGPMNKAIAHADAKWRESVLQDPMERGRQGQKHLMRTGEMPPTSGSPLTVNDLATLTALRTEQHAAAGFGTGESEAHNRGIINDLMGPITNQYKRTNVPSKRYEEILKRHEANTARLQQAVDNISTDPQGAVAAMRKSADEHVKLIQQIRDEGLYTEPMYREDLAKTLGILKQNESMDKLTPKDAQRLHEAEKLYPYEEAVNGRLFNSYQEGNYPTLTGASEMRTPMDLGASGKRYITPSATVPIRKALNEHIYNRQVGESGNSRRAIAEEAKSVIRDFLDRYEYSSKLKELDPAANLKYAISGKMATYAQKAPVRGQPIRLNLGIASPYLYDELINNYNKPAAAYAASKGIDKLLLGLGSRDKRTSRKSSPKNK